MTEAEKILKTAAMGGLLGGSLGLRFGGPIGGAVGVRRWVGRGSCPRNRGRGCEGGRIAAKEVKDLLASLAGELSDDDE